MEVEPNKDVEKENQKDYGHSDANKTLKHASEIDIKISKTLGTEAVYAKLSNGLEAKIKDNYTKS